MSNKSKRITSYTNGYVKKLKEQKFGWAKAGYYKMRDFAKLSMMTLVNLINDIRGKDKNVSALAADELTENWIGNPNATYMRQVFTSETGIPLGCIAQTKLVIEMLEAGMRMDRIRRKARKALDYDGDRWHGWLDTLSKAKARQMNRWIDTEVLDFREKGRRVLEGTLLEYMNYMYDIEGKLKTETKSAHRYGKEATDYLVNGYYVCKSAYEYAKYLNARKSLEDVVGWQRECEKVKLEKVERKAEKEAA